MKPRNLVVKVPISKPAIAAALALIRNAGYTHARDVDTLSERRENLGATELAIRGGTDGDSGQSNNVRLYDGNSGFGPCHIVDLRPVFSAIEPPLTLKVLGAVEPFPVTINKEKGDTKIGCSTFKTVDLLSLADAIRARK